MKSTLEWMDILDIEEEKTNKVKKVEIGITQNKDQKKTETKITQPNDLWGNIKHLKICILGVLKGGGSQNKYFKKEWLENAQK